MRNLTGSLLATVLTMLLTAVAAGGPVLAQGSKPGRDASDLRGIWQCKGHLATNCTLTDCTAVVQLNTRTSANQYTGRTKFRCDTRAKRGCTLNKDTKPVLEAEGELTAQVKDNTVRVTSVVAPPNSDLSSISEYEVQGNTIIFKRDLQGGTQDYSESCTWSPLNSIEPARR